MNSSSRIAVKALLLICFLLTTVTSISSIKAQSSFSGTGAGTTDSPYVIANCVQLQQMSGDLEAVYSLANDIDCSGATSFNDGNGFLPVGQGEQPFRGRLIGNGKKINNLTITSTLNGVGLFGSIDSSGVVSNLKLLNAHITSSGYYVGVLAGVSYGSTFENIEVIGATVSGEWSVGGVVGQGANTHISNVRSSGSVTGIYRIGGILGYDDANVTIANSVNDAAVNGEHRIGGLLGSAGGQVTITGSVNNGAVTSTVISSYTFPGVGGLIGAAWKITITESYNSGTITTHGGGLYVGGLIGCGGKVLVQESYNSGTINAVIWSDNYNGVGGIIGSAINATLTNVYNKGDITIEGNNRPVGGVLGFSFVANIQNTYNSGDVTQQIEGDTLSIGGIVGQIYFNEWTFGQASNGSPIIIERLEKLFTLIRSFNVGILHSLGNSIVGGLVGEIIMDGEDTSSEVVTENNWWAGESANGIGRILEYGDAQPNEPTVAAKYEKESLAAAFKTYSHIVYNTAPDWDFATIWSNVYEEKGYPVLAFQNIVTPSTPTANPSSKYFATSVSVTLSSANADKIKYTIDGTSPTCSTGIQYSSAIVLSSTRTVKAIGCSSDLLLNSAVATFTYTKGAAPLSTNLVITQLPTVPESTAKIILDEFNEYLNGVGSEHTLKDEQVIYFNIGAEEHTVTIKNITDGVVTIVIASTPQTVSFKVGDTKEFDIDADGLNDIRVNLKEIFGSKASLIFTKIVPKVVVSSTPTVILSSTPTAVSNTVIAQKINSNWLLICGSGLIFFAIIIIVFQIRKKKVQE